MTVGITELPPEGMQLGGVALAGDTERGTKTTEGLSLLFTTAGITVQGPQPQIERLLVWSGLDSATCREKVVLPDGRNAAVMELTSGGQSIRFLFPTESVTPGQAAYLDQALPHWLARYKGAPPSPVMANGYGSDSGNGNGQDAPGPAAGATSNGAPPPPPAGTAGGLPPMTPAAGAAAAGAVAGAAAAAAAGPSSDPAATGQYQAAPGASPAVGAPSGATVPPPPPPPASVAPPAPAGASGEAAVGSPPPPPPPPQTTLGVAPGFASGSPGSPPPPPGVTPTTPPGWETPTGSLPDGSAWAGPPTGVAGEPGPSQGKRAKGWRRSKKDVATADPRPGAFDPSRPPFEPPVDPVPLTQSTLPPPPPEGAGLPTAVGPVVWKPPVDPVTGEALWEGQPGTPSGLDPEPKPLSGRAKRKADKAAKAAAAGAAVAVGVGVGGAQADPFAGPPPATMTPGSPESTLPGTPPATGAPTALTEPFDPTMGSLPPTTPGGGFDDPVEPGAGGPAPAGNRRLLVLLVVALVVVVAAIGYFVVKRNNNTTSATSTTVSGLSTDAALATSINLRQSDLPAGWAPTTSTGQARPPVAPAAAQSQASQTLAQCLGVPVATVTGLFGGAGLPGQTSSATSPVFESAADPTVQMQSVTRVMGSAAQASTLVAPFTNPNFVTCYTAYQTTLVSAADAGSTAQVQAVALTAPTGVQSFGYLTTLTIPSQGSEVIGQAFMVGGRIESVLQPTTGGVAVPTPAFTSAYNAMSGRIGLAATK